ncbi:hypothetical protein HC766_07445 [Candidatus Gracilibacteria bacterium]|nr:hypothetical protein [Candidatus Gracilibacteria bacterium]
MSFEIEELGGLRWKKGLLFHRGYARTIDSQPSTLNSVGGALLAPPPLRFAPKTINSKLKTYLPQSAQNSKLKT